MGDPTVFQKTLLNIFGGEEFVKGVEVFISQRRKPDIPIGTDEKTHYLNTINFSCPRVA
jgi:hypothetical protein